MTEGKVAKGRVCPYEREETLVSQIKELNMMELAKYQCELRENPKLRFLFFELTDRCNLQCVHCGSGCTSSNNTYLSYDVIEKTLISVSGRYDPSKIMICFTGGEPLLHPFVMSAIRIAHDLHFLVGITTNGTLIDDIVAHRLKKAGIDTIAVSIDGDEETHDLFRGVPGSYKKAINGILALKRSGIEPQVLSVVHKGNIDQLEQMFTLFSEMDIYSWRLINVEPIGRAKCNDEILLDNKELKYLFDFIRRKRFDNTNKMDVTYGCSHFVTYEYENEIRDFYFQCGAGTITASIAANGDMIGCLDIERRKDLIQGNAYKDEFADVWEKKYQIFRQNRSLLNSDCKACKYASVCGGDSAHTWDYERNKPLYCIVRLIGE